jgi:hypothetical protein
LAPIHPPLVAFSGPSSLFRLCYGIELCVYDDVTMLGSYKIASCNMPCNCREVIVMKCQSTRLIFVNTYKMAEILRSDSDFSVPRFAIKLIPLKWLLRHVTKNATLTCHSKGYGDE